MQFSQSILSLALLTLTLASPVPEPKAKSSTAVASTSAAAATKAASSASATGASTATATGTSGSVLKASTYNDIQISGGTAGTAQDEANALFSAIDMNNLAGVSADDLAIIKGTHDAAEDAETSAFDPAVDAATGTAATALQVRSLPAVLIKTACINMV